MNLEEARAFLMQHSPMPSDDVLDQETIDRFNEIRHLLINKPDLELLKLFMTSFGDGSGFGVYQLSDDVLRAYKFDEATLAILHGLQSKNQSARYWNLQFSGDFPSQKYRPYLYDALSSSIVDERFFAAASLSNIYDSSIDSDKVKELLQSETDSETKTILSQMLSNT